MALRPKILAVTIWLLAGAVLLSGNPALAGTTAPSINEVTVVTAQAQHKFRVELAATEGTRRTGLMHRRALANEAGMLFIFPNSARHSFWMKNTLIPLDMLFIASDGRIVYVHHMAQPHSLTPIAPPQDARAILEINGGLSRRLGIAAGDQVLHPRLTGQ